MNYRFEGYVIVSADGMLADATGSMPETLKFAGDQQFFSASLDRADLIVHGRNSFEDQAHSPRRKRLIATRSTPAVSADPTSPKATFWNPRGASFEDAAARAGVASGTVAVIGGPGIFAMFLPRYDVFFLSRAPLVQLPGGAGAFPGVPAKTPEEILTAHNLAPAERRVLDAAHDVSVTAWRRAPPSARSRESGNPAIYGDGSS